ncbi:MAG: hypothetical protein D6790_02960 [Caldilineae bacterium]|nr:MAG: hypothetical protein D6790_02960 [Caldilineae bacterium]
MLQALDYDFTHFTVAAFLRWLGMQQPGRTIVQCHWKLPASISGAWIPIDRIDYIFLPDDVHPLHRTHILLHEIGHILCGHTPVLGQADLPLLIAGRIDAVDLAVRSLSSVTAEQEAEYLATVLHACQLYGGEQFPALLVPWPDPEAIYADLCALHSWLVARRSQSRPGTPPWLIPAETPALLIYQAVIQVLDELRWLRDESPQSGLASLGLEIGERLELSPALSYEEIVFVLRQASRALQTDAPS